MCLKGTNLLHTRGTDPLWKWKIIFFSSEKLIIQFYSYRLKKQRNTYFYYFRCINYERIVNATWPKFLFAGSTIFSDILAKDNDKVNTPNSDVHYSIVGGNERGKFSLEDNNPASLLLRNPLDYDAGDTDFLLTILASVRNFTFL